MKPQMKPEYNRGDYPIERFAWDAKRAVADLLDVAQFNEIQKRDLERVIAICDQYMLDDMADFDSDKVPF